MTKRQLNLRVKSHLLDAVKKTAIDLNITVTEILEKYMMYLYMQTLRNKKRILLEKGHKGLKNVIKTKE